MLEALGAVFGGIWFIIVSPRLWLYSLVPAVLLILLTCGLFGVGILGANWTTNTLVGEPESFWGHVGSWTLATTLWLLALMMALLLALVLAQPLSGFALEAVTLAQERALLGFNQPRSSFLAALWVSTRATIWMLLFGGVVYTVLFVIDFFFPPALVVTAPLRYVAGGWLMAWNFLDYPLSLRGLGVLARVRWSARHFEEFTVFGLVWALLLFVPGLFFLVLPMGVAGATRLVVLSEQQDQAEAAKDEELVATELLE